jgi:MFS family permease
MIYCVALLQSLSFALLVAAKTALSDETMAEEDKITGQSMMAMTDAFGAVAGNIIGGVIIGYGVTPMLIVGSLIALVGTIIVFIAARINSKRKLRIQ